MGRCNMLPMCTVKFWWCVLFLQTKSKISPSLWRSDDMCNYVIFWKWIAKLSTKHQFFIRFFFHETSQTVFSFSADVTQRITFKLVPYWPQAALALESCTRKKCILLTNWIHTMPNQMEQWMWYINWSKCFQKRINMKCAVFYAAKTF